MGRFTKKFTENQERAILSFYYTSPFADVAFVKPMPGFGPEEQASLMAKVSRNPEPQQKKFMKMVEKNPNIDMDLVDRLTKDPNLFLSGGITGSLSKDSARFHTQFSLGMHFSAEEKDTAIRGFGDDTVKDGASVLYTVENVLDNDNKLITQNPTDRPQVASTRYIDFKKQSKMIEVNPDIAKAKYGGEILGVMRMLSDAYIEFSDRAEAFVAKHPLNLEFQNNWLSEESLNDGVNGWKKSKLRVDPERKFGEKELLEVREKMKKRREGPDYQKYARKTIFDYTRYLLFPGIPTYMSVASDAHTLEKDISTLLSSPMQTARDLGDNILKEGRKICPTLLGKHTHAKRSEFLVNMRQELSDFVKLRIESDRARSFGEVPRTKFYNGLPDEDVFAAATTVYQYSNSSFEKIYNHFSKNPKDIKHIVDTTLRLRGKFDHDPEGLLHGGSMMENFIDYGAYRDLQRHRRGHKTRQLLTTYYGAEMPSLFKLMGLDGKFNDLMGKADSTYRLVAEDNPYVAQLMIPFAFRIGTLYSWSHGQSLFASKLRSGEGGIISYRKVAWDIDDELKRRKPEFSRLSRVNRDVYPAELINLKEAKKWFNETKRGKYENRSSR